MVKEIGHTISPEVKIHPAFLRFAEICAEIGFGQIDCLKIENGLPVFVETTKGSIILPGARITKKTKLV